METLDNIGAKSKDLISFAGKEISSSEMIGRIDYFGCVAEVFDEKYMEEPFISHVKESAKKIGIGENNIGIIFREIGEWIIEGNPVMTAFADKESWDNIYEYAKKLGVLIGEIQDPEYPNYDFYLFDITE